MAWPAQRQPLLLRPPTDFEWSRPGLISTVVGLPTCHTRLDNLVRIITRNPQATHSVKYYTYSPGDISTGRLVTARILLAKYMGYCRTLQVPGEARIFRIFPA